MITITGASGAVGARVSRLLAEQHHPRRLLVRDPAGLAPESGVELAQIESYTDDIGLRAALTGCDTLLLVSARESADRVREHRMVIEAAVDAGLGEIVYTSFRGASADATSPSPVTTDPPSSSSSRAGSGTSSCGTRST